MHITSFKRVQFKGYIFIDRKQRTKLCSKEIIQQVEKLEFLAVQAHFRSLVKIRVTRLSATISANSNEIRKTIRRDWGVGPTLNGVRISYPFLVGLLRLRAGDWVIRSIVSMKAATDLARRGRLEEGVAGSEVSFPFPVPSL